MNERIKELAEEAGLSLIHDKFMTASQEKFAELLIKECASICELNGKSYSHSLTPAKARLAESTSNHCGLMIKRHFGVNK